MNKYPALSFVSAIVKFVGWLGVIIAVIMLFVGIGIIMDSRNNSFGAYSGTMSIISSFCIAIGSLMIILVGEGIKVFLDIEKNTSETAKLLLAMSNGKMGAVATATSGQWRESGPRTQGKADTGGLKLPLAARDIDALDRDKRVIARAVSRQAALQLTGLVNAGAGLQTGGAPTGADGLDLPLEARDRDILDRHARLVATAAGPTEAQDLVRVANGGGGTPASGGEPEPPTGSPATA
jgi:hypothetical protein